MGFYTSGCQCFGWMSDPESIQDIRRLPVEGKVVEIPLFRGFLYIPGGWEWDVLPSTVVCLIQPEVFFSAKSGGFKQCVLVRNKKIGSFTALGFNLLLLMVQQSQGRKLGDGDKT